MTLDYLATSVVLLVFGPPLIIAVTVVTLCAVGLFLADGPRRVWKTFRCPIKERKVRVEFAVPAGATRPSGVASCSAFPDPTRVPCAKGCLEMAEVHWTPPVSVLARSGLSAGGAAPSGRPTPEPAVETAA